MLPIANNLNFPSKIYQILENESRDIIRWNDNGLSFYIVDQARFESEILPLYFRHNQMSSVQRQLNLYGFKSICRGNHKRSYYHPDFKRGNSEVIAKLSRYIPPNRRKKNEENKDSSKNSSSISGDGIPKIEDITSLLHDVAKEEKREILSNQTLESLSSRYLTNQKVIKLQKSNESSSISTESDVVKISVLNDLEEEGWTIPMNEPKKKLRTLDSWKPKQHTLNQNHGFNHNQNYYNAHHSYLPINPVVGMKRNFDEISYFDSLGNLQSASKANFVSGSNQRFHEIHYGSDFNASVPSDPYHQNHFFFHPTQPANISLLDQQINEPANRLLAGNFEQALTNSSSAVPLSRSNSLDDLMSFLVENN